MSEFFEYDPMTGIRTDTAWDEGTQQMTLVRTADVEPILDFSKAAANEVGKNSKDIKRGWLMYASLPPIVVLQMMRKGINVFDNNDQKRLLEEINENYSHLKTTTGMEGARSSRQIYVPPSSARSNATDGGATNSVLLP